VPFEIPRHLDLDVCEEPRGLLAWRLAVAVVRVVLQGSSTPPASTWFDKAPITTGDRAASTVHSGCRGTGECRTPRPCTFVLADMSSADDRVPSQNRPPASIRIRSSGTLSLVLPFSWCGGSVVPTSGTRTLGPSR
jgi:hypothetical protein